jgi:type VI secretion system protein ImpI
MRMVLEVVSRQATEMGPNRRTVVGPRGARIGRDPSNDWVLADSYVSSHHATISFSNDMYFVEGHGTNITAVNDLSRPLPMRDPRVLQDGDRLYIDQYEISVRLVADEAEVEPIADETLELDRVPSSETNGNAGRRSDGSVNPLDLLNATKRDHAPTSRRPRPSPSVMPESSDRPPKVPDNWHQTQYPRPPPEPADARMPDPAPRPTAPDFSELPDFGAFLRGAGLDPDLALDNDTARDLGAALRLTVESTMKLLRARAELKRQFRLPGTYIEAGDNNPLKFSADAEEALAKLLGQRSPRYLDTVPAFEDAFSEIQFHQVALLSGLRAGFERMLTFFDPQRQEPQPEERPWIDMIGVQRARLWDAHVQAYAELREDPESTFHQLFGDAFAAAYEAQMRRLKYANRRPRRPDQDRAS